VILKRATDPHGRDRAFRFRRSGVYRSPFRYWEARLKFSTDEKRTRLLLLRAEGQSMQNSNRTRLRILHNLQYVESSTRVAAEEAKGESEAPTNKPTARVSGILSYAQKN
jgi:hypothetical protein